MAAFATNGTPDLWLSGPFGDRWVEVKWDPITKGALRPKLSPLQKKWISERVAEGRDVVVITAVSLKEAVMYSRMEWVEPHREVVEFPQLIKDLLRGVA